MGRFALSGTPGTPNQADERGALQVFPARVLPDPEGRATAAQLTERAKARALDPAILDEFPPIFWTAEISNNRLDAYFTRMAVSTLRNFEVDAKAGVSFQDSHRTDGLERTLGQSLGARYIGPNAQGRPEGVAAVEADFYTLTGMDLAVDAFVRKVRGGLVRDVSVGFYGGWFRCSICGRDMFDYTDYQNYCIHLPGRKYAKHDETGKKTDERVVATADVEDARLAETSGVYDGATPEASILAIKARQLADAGQLEPEAARLLAVQHRIFLPDVGPKWPGVDLSERKPKEGEMGDRPERREPEATDEAQARESERNEAREHGMALVRTAAAGALADIGLPIAEDADLAEAIRAHGAELRELRQQAEDGRTYRAQTIEDALTEGVRALGDKFDRDGRKRVLERLTLDEIIERRDTWAEAAKLRFPGGRQTAEGGGEPSDGEAEIAPDAAFAG